MKSRYVSLRKNPAGSPENKKISYPGKGTRFGKHLFIMCLKIEYTLWVSSLNITSKAHQKKKKKSQQQNFMSITFQKLYHTDNSETS